MRSSRCGRLSLKNAQVGGGEGGGMSISVVEPEIIDACKRVIASLTSDWRRSASKPSQPPSPRPRVFEAAFLHTRPSFVPR